MQVDDQEAWQDLSPHAFVKVVKAASLLGLSKATVRRLCRSGVLPALRCGREWRVELAAIHRIRRGDVQTPGRVR